MSDDHPVSILRARLSDDFTDDLPPRVHPVHAWCGGPQFFPGSTGLLTESSWSEVVPGSQGIDHSFPPAPLRGIIVLGNYQATANSYRRLADGSLGGFPTTWRALAKLMAATNPRDVFLTNAYIGLPELVRDTDPFPTTPSFVERCRRLLVLEIELFEPRAVVCLGVSAAKMLASIASDLEAWQPWPGYKRLESAGQQSIAHCRVASIDFTAVAVQHPSAVQSSAQRQREAAIVSAAMRPSDI